MKCQCETTFYTVPESFNDVSFILKIQFIISMYMPCKLTDCPSLYFAVLSVGLLNESVKVYAILKYTYFQNAFSVILHISLVFMFIYCWYRSCRQTKFISCS